jgi:hypothetical protein
MEHLLVAVDQAEHLELLLLVLLIAQMAVYMVAGQALKVVVEKTTMALMVQ